MRFTTINGQVTRCTVQYETRSAGQWEPVLRYDNAHDAPHRDQMNRRGNQISKQWFSGVSNAEALDKAIEDITDNWRSHHRHFESE